MQRNIKNGAIILGLLFGTISSTDYQRGIFVD